MSTPEKHDEIDIYNLNANVKLVSRKMQSQDKVHQLIKQFKDDNPQLIQRLNNQKNVIDVTVTSNNGYSTSLNYNDELNKTIMDNTHVNEKPNTPNCKDSNILTSNCNYNSVKSSNELLHSVINIEKDLEYICGSNEPDDNSIHNRLSSLDIPEVIENTFSGNSRNSNDLQNYAIICSNNFSEDNRYDAISNEEAINISNINDDLADELTQVLEEDFMYETRTSSQNSDQIKSLDTDFMTETVNEINQELNRDVINLENLVLTPPVQFRD